MQQVTDITLLGKPVSGKCKLQYLAPLMTLEKMVCSGVYRGYTSRLILVTLY